MSMQTFASCQVQSRAAHARSDHELQAESSVGADLGCWSSIFIRVREFVRKEGGINTSILLEYLIREVLSTHIRMKSMTVIDS